MNKQQLEIPSEIRGYLESLLVDANVPTLDEETREEMINGIYQRLESFLTAKIIENMPAEYLEDFTRLNENGKSNEEIQNFIKEKMPNAEEVFKQAFVDFRNLYVSGVTIAKNAPSANK